MNITNKDIERIYPKLRAFSMTLSKSFSPKLKFEDHEAIGYEIAHSVIIKALETNFSWKNLKHFEAWLINSCKFTSIDRLRKKKEDQLKDEKTQNNIPSKNFYGDIEVNRIYEECIDKIDKKKKEVFQISYFETKTTKEIAIDLNKPQNTILTWLADAKKQFVECVESKNA